MAVAIFAIGMLALGKCVENLLRAEKFRREDALAQRALTNYWAQIEAGALPLADKASEKLTGAWPAHPAGRAPRRPPSRSSGRRR